MSRFEYAFSTDSKRLPSAAPPDLSQYLARNHFEPSLNRVNEVITGAADHKWELFSHSVTMVGTELVISYLLRRETD